MNLVQRRVLSGHPRQGRPAPPLSSVSTLMDATPDTSSLTRAFTATTAEPEVVSARAANTTAPAATRDVPHRARLDSAVGTVSASLMPDTLQGDSRGDTPARRP